MDHSPFRQTFELEIFNIVKGKYSPVKFDYFAYFCTMRGKCNHISNYDYTFPRIIQKYTKFENFSGLYFPHFAMFCY